MYLGFFSTFSISTPVLFISESSQGKMQTADYSLLKYIPCYFCYRVLTVNRICQANRSESTADLHSGYAEYHSG